MASTSDTSDHLLLSRAEDILEQSDRHGAPCYLGFLDLREQAVLRKHLSHFSATCYAFIGGYDSSERCLLSAYPHYYSVDDLQPPITAIAFRYRPVAHLTHRDFLGTLMSVGIRRDKIGDILCGDGLAVVFVRSEVADYVGEQIDRVGGEGVTPELNYDGDLPIRREYEEIRDTVASPRLDAVLKCLTRFSREKAAESIRLGLVSVDHLPVESVSLSVTAPCTISVRGMGRYLVDSIGPPTKKGRLILTARKCI